MAHLLAIRRWAEVDTEAFRKKSTVTAKFLCIWFGDNRVSNGVVDSLHGGGGRLSWLDKCIDVLVTAASASSRLGNASRVIMGEKAFQTFLLESGLEPESNSSPQELRRVLLSEVERWTPVIKGIGLQLE
jgi:hypothetical protein